MANELHSDQTGVQCPKCQTQQPPGARFCGNCRYQFAPDAYVGQVLNKRFVVESKIGEGGFGAVYRGKQTRTGRQVALKLLHPDMTQDENLVERFRREGLLLCKLRDAHTITTYDFDQTEDGTLYIAMELLEGRSLHEVFHREAPLGWRRMVKILSEMCTSLAEAHDAGIVHRDLKPENIYLESRPGNPEFVKILDFGIAKVMHGDMVGGGTVAQLTASGQTLGTLEYMSPEQLMGKELDGRSDIYALGVLTYEMITGRLPFPNAKGPAGLITAQLRQVPEPPSAVNQRVEIPPNVDQLVLKMLEKTKEQRFGNVDEIRQSCLELLGSGQWGPEVTAQALAPSPAELVGPAQPQPGPAAPMPSGLASSGRPPQHQLQTPPQVVRHSSHPGSHHDSTPLPGGLNPGPAPAPAMSPGAMSPGPGRPPGHAPAPMAMAQSPAVSAHDMQVFNATARASQQPPSSRMWLWLLIALIVVGGAIGAALALA